MAYVADLHLRVMTFDGGRQRPATTCGGDYAPYLIERFIRRRGSTLSLYCTLSNGNPCTLVLMRSDFALGGPARRPRPGPRHPGPSERGRG